LVFSFNTGSSAPVFSHIFLEVLRKTMRRPNQDYCRAKIQTQNIAGLLISFAARFVKNNDGNLHLHFSNILSRSMRLTLPPAHAHKLIKHFMYSVRPKINWPQATYFTLAWRTYNVASLSLSRVTSQCVMDEAALWRRGCAIGYDVKTYFRYIVSPRRGGSYNKRVNPRGGKWKGYQELSSWHGNYVVTHFNFLTALVWSWRLCWRQCLERLAVA
jgi:hypothetical protein